MEKKPMPSPADLMAVNMATLTRLIVHLDERGAANAEAFLVELLQIGRGLPPGQAAAHALLCGNLQQQIEASRARRQPPIAGKH